MKKKLKDKLANSKSIKIDIINKINNNRNDWIAEISKKFFIHCLGLIYDDEFEINFLILSEEKQNDYKTVFKLDLTNFSRNKDFSIPYKNIVENSAICLNLALIPLFFDYEDGMVLKRGEVADYILYSNTGNFTLESKGVTSKYNCPKKILEGKIQIEESFEVFKDSNVNFGIIGESCFYEQVHYLVKIKNNKYNINSDLELEEIKQEIKESSKLITKAITLKDLGKEESKEVYKKASQKESEIASKLERLNPKLAKNHWISAISCNYEAEEYPEVILWINDFEEREDLSQKDKILLKELKIKAQTNIKLDIERIIKKSTIGRLIRYILFQNEEIHNKIQGKGNIIKEMYIIRNYFLEHGFNLPIPFSINRNPIFSKELSELLQKYIDSKFLIRNFDKSLNLSTKAKLMLKNEKDFTERIIKNNFSELLIIKIQDIIKKLGDKTSSELEEIERKRRITSFQYGKEIL